ncbi:hypothetical protein [Winogradskyella poriferorum]|uniref:hypothetical protein n=1 Tax=Winogradskyella poriferorum TaxID=307627 RepID=UPI003D65D0CF
MKNSYFTLIILILFNCNQDNKKPLSKEVQLHKDAFKEAFSDLKNADTMLYFYKWNQDYTDSIKIKEPNLAFIYDYDLLQTSLDAYKRGFNKLDSLQFLSEKFDTLPNLKASQINTKLKYLEKQQKLIDRMQHVLKVQGQLYDKNGKMLN